MINFFPELKRPKSDGMRSALGLEDYRNPFEIHFGLFGEDDSSDGAADNNPEDAAAGRFSGRGNTRAAAGTPSRGTTFGVDGVSKTGSTALDAQIGYTDDDNRGNPGANFNALNNATSEQTIAAVAAAREAQDRGGSPGQVESAVGSALDNYSTGTVDRSGGLTDKGRSYIDDIVNQTFAPPSDSPVSQALSAGDVTSPDLMPNQIGITAPVSREEQLRKATARMMGDDPNAPVQLTVAEQASLDEQTRRSDAGLIALAQQREKELQGQRAIDAINRNLGITAAPAATAANVIGSDNMNLVNDARFGGPATLPTAAGTVRDLQRARGDASMLEDLRDTAPASIAAGPVLSGATTVDDDFAEMGQRGGLTQAQINAGIGYDARGLPRGLQTFTNNQGITATTNLAGTTQAQRDNMPGYMNPEEGGLQDSIFGNPLDTAYGYELNRQGDVTGVVGRPMGGGLMGAGAELLTNAIMGPPESVEDLLNRSVYTGPTQVGMDGSDGGGDSPTKAANDPCPAGYQMVNGACQISDDLMGPIQSPEAGSGFVINPNTGLPTLFQPTTQATQVGQVNPFALQPYTPMQAQNIQQARSGIQALSPTGAALGRAI